MSCMLCSLTGLSLWYPSGQIRAQVWSFSCYVSIFSTWFCTLALCLAIVCCAFLYKLSPHAHTEPVIFRTLLYLAPPASKMRKKGICMVILLRPKHCILPFSVIYCVCTWATSICMWRVRVDLYPKYVLLYLPSQTRQWKRCGNNSRYFNGISD